MSELPRENGWTIAEWAGGAARWSLPGGEAVLHLRAVIAGGDFEDYWTYHVSRECQRSHARLQ